MARVFVHYDGGGEILGVSSVELMSEELPHPFHLEDPGHRVVEVPADHEAFRGGLEHAAATHRVDVATGTLVAKTTRGRAPAKPRTRRTPSR